MSAAAVYPTPEEAAAATRNGRPGWIVCIRLRAGWRAAYADPYLTKGAVLAAVRAALLCAPGGYPPIPDTCVAVIGADGERLPIPRPRPRKSTRPPTGAA